MAAISPTVPSTSVPLQPQTRTSKICSYALAILTYITPAYMQTKAAYSGACFHHYRGEGRYLLTAIILTIKEVFMSIFRGQRDFVRGKVRMSPQLNLQKEFKNHIVNTFKLTFQNAPGDARQLASLIVIAARETTQHQTKYLELSQPAIMGPLIQDIISQLCAHYKLATIESTA